MVSYLFSPAGRFSRMQWWLFGLVQILGFVLAILISLVGASISPVLFAVGALFVLPVMWGGICANIKRFHDRGKSGWWLLISFVPVVGSIWILVELGLLAGDDSENNYGPPPGEARRLANLEAEVGALAGNSRLAKIDDDYFARYKAQAAAQAAAAAPRGTLPAAGGGKPVFGRRT